MSRVHTAPCYNRAYRTHIYIYTRASRTLNRPRHIVDRSCRGAPIGSLPTTKRKKISVTVSQLYRTVGMFIHHLGPVALNGRYALLEPFYFRSIFVWHRGTVPIAIVRPFLYFRVFRRSPSRHCRRVSTSVRQRRSAFA